MSIAWLFSDMIFDDWFIIVQLFFCKFNLFNLVFVEYKLIRTFTRQTPDYNRLIENDKRHQLLVDAKFE